MLGADHLAADAAVGRHEIFGADGAEPGVDQAQAKPCENSRRRPRQHQPTQALGQVQAQHLGRLIELWREIGDAALGGDEQRKKRGEGDEHPLGQFPQAEPRGEQRHPGENGDLAEGGEGRAEHAFTGARQSQQQAQSKAEPATEQ
ncbi:hypothetical protein D9M71_362400 [compost metagenome]